MRCCSSATTGGCAAGEENKMWLRKHNTYGACAGRATRERNLLAEFGLAGHGDRADDEEGAHGAVSYLLAMANL